MQRNEESDEFASSVRASAAQINEGPRPPVRARCQQAPRTQNQHALGSAARSGVRVHQNAAFWLPFGCLLAAFCFWVKNEFLVFWEY